MIGSTLGLYRVLEKLGEGGMGEVYRARDTRLDREVALKILPASFAGDPDRLMRFEREAKTLAALNHPHIAQIYGLAEGEASGAPILVMELVEGEDLAARIARGPIPLDEALPIARQIAEALEAAHEAGIVHRDLKPANVKVRADGTVKVLDFGLAKALDPAVAGSGAGAAPAHAATMTSPALTMHGVILGTAAYMAPEQAKGKPVDRRADIWAFGCVLYETLTGRQAFSGETMTDVLAAIVTAEPDWTLLPAATPPQVRRLLIRCLDKDPRQRLRDIGEARWELERGADLELMAPAGSDGSIARSRAWPAWTAAALGLILASLAWFRPVPPADTGAPLLLSIVPGSATVLAQAGSGRSAPVIAPDGSAVLYRGTGGLHVRWLDTLETIHVPGSEAAQALPFWSADGSTVLYPTPDRLLAVRLPDGAPEPVMPLSGPTRGGSISDTGVILVSLGSALLARSAPGAPPISVDTSALPATRLTYPQFLPGSDEFLVHRLVEGRSDGTYLARLRDGALVDPVLLVHNDSAASFTPAGGGHVLFVRDDNLYAQRFDRTARALTGQPSLIAAGVASQPGLIFPLADFSVARNGTVAWRPGRAASAQVTELDRAGRQIGLSGPPGPINAVALAPDDGRLIARGDVDWLLEAGRPGRLELPASATWFDWSRDGSRVIGLTAQKEVLEHEPESTAEPVVLGELPAGTSPRLLTRSPDGRSLLWAEVGTGALRAARLSGDAEERRPRDLVAGGGLQGGRFSPDGRWIVYAGMDSTYGIYVQPFPGPGRRRQIAPAGNSPIWRGDGREILYRFGNAVWSVAVEHTGSDLRAGEPVRLFEGLRPAPGGILAAHGLAVSRDGSRIFVPQALEQPAGDVIHVMIGRLR
jgi:eukaryotic-like serine/threonine-protein kinase